MAQIIPGILTADEADYERRLSLAQTCPLIQIDLVDGKFSLNKTVGIDAIQKYPSEALLEIQLMVVSPLSYIDALGRLEFVSKIIFPLEIPGDIKKIIGEVKTFGKKVGISTNPDTPVETISDFADNIDLYLQMTGKPGYSGQKLGESTYERIELSKKLYPDLPLEIDIGVNFENAEKLAASGADFLVASSALYGSDNFAEAYRKLANIAKTR